MKEYIEKSFSLRIFRNWKTINPVCVFGLLFLIVASPLIGQEANRNPQDENRTCRTRPGYSTQATANTQVPE